MKKVKDFSCGEDHAAYVDYNGNVFTWGFGGDGQLGHGDTNTMATPKKLSFFNDKKVIKVECGGGHTAFLTDQNEVYMCGKGRDG